MGKDGSKRRKYHRFDQDTRVLYRKIKGKALSEAVSVNMSSGGTFIRTEKPLPVGTELNLTFQVPSRFLEIAAKGRVTWVADENDDDPGMGIEFTEIDPIAQYDLMRGVKQGGWLYAFGVLAEK